ncbi:transmembrane protein 43 [Cotesia typhae]|uniref:transmembrane protein 43 n=1 Tax=Cotesia typhae TaxID=2053667 RepID=UPI003D69088E
MHRNNANVTERRLQRDPVAVENNANPQINNNLRHLSPTIIEQLKKSWLTAIIGCILCAVGTCLLFWNEGRAASVAQSLNEALEQVAIIDDLWSIPTEYEGRLVHISGQLWIDEPLTEPDYGVIIESVKLKRRVQVYQWIEIEEDRVYGGEVQEDKNYYYTTEWKDKLVDSDQFYIRTGHENPKQVPIKSQIQIANQVKIGSVALGLDLKKKFTDFIEITSDQRPERTDIKMHAGLYYHSADLWNPRVGDIRILFSYAGKAGEVYTVIGKLIDGTIVPFFTSQGDEILLQRKHQITVDRMFHLEHVHNYWRTWVIRALGWLILFASATCLANILRILIQNSSFLCGIIAIDSLTISVSMSISLLIIGFAWMWYRPVVALCLAFAAVLPFLYSYVSPNQQRDDYRRI